MTLGAALFLAVVGVEVTLGLAGFAASFFRRSVADG
jgi:hypothetical protein